MNSPPIIESLSKTMRVVILGGAAAITLVIALGAFSETPFLKPLDFFFYDRFMAYTAVHKKTPDRPDRVVIVDVDETSLSAAGQWPWPRYRMARLLAILAREHPKAIGLDIVFPEPDQSSLKNIRTQFQKDFNLAIDFTRVPASLTDNDLFFAQILNQTRTVGARYFYFDHASPGGVCRQSIHTITDPENLLSLHTAQGVLCNTSSIETLLESAGFINNQYDGDGLLRQTPLLIGFQNEIYPHLSLAVLMKALDLTTARVEKGGFGPEIILGDHRIPITRDGFVSIGFKGPSRTHHYLSAVDILNQNFSPADIRDKIVLVGSSAVGLNDIHHTIFDPYFPGIEISAVIMDNIETAGFIIRPEKSALFISLVCGITGILLAALFFRISGPWLLFSATLSWMGLVLGASLLFFFQWNLFLSPAAPLLLGILLFSFLSFARFADEKRAAFIWYQQLADAQQLTMEAMVSMVETRDPETGEHIVRTQHYAKAIAEQLRTNGHFPDILSDRFIKTLFLSTPLHDIGKVGIPDNILLKPGQLTDEEFVQMKLHAGYGETIIQRASGRVTGSSYLEMAAQIAGTHHEKWNGLGYPRGLSREDIPLAGRIMAISDVYDALISKRCYKPPFSHEKAMAILHEEKGKLFDPIIVDAFFEIEPAIKQIAAQLEDHET
ncbi:MAG: CHASE2 domain-containing protein [Proteobacteria bacterium]|nr:CHASE2 domain-containing protein [Desulfobacula sp.]MBU3953614.1 CHASE2 domain-containing protein [Pseudomonadota bacterium]MBU4133243.1 CHASE2 domain-containing protein [Pseudomonadota bacterium]